jgi:hypothetical protein
MVRHRTRPSSAALRARLAVAAMCAIAITAVPASTSASASASVGDVEDGSVALIGHQDHGQVAAAATLTAAGITVGSVVEYPRNSIDATAVAASDLVLLTVSALDGPMPGTLQVLEDLDGYTIERLGVLITNSALNGDPELISLVIAEAVETVGRYGVPAPVPVVTADAPSFPDDVRALLAAPSDDIVVAAPTTVPPTSTVIPGLDGLPLDRAISILAAEGLEVTVIADPSLGVEVECSPPVRRQVPEPGLEVPRGTTVAVIGGLRASSLGCDLPVLSADELAAAVDAVWQQPGLPPRFVTMPIVTNNIPLSSATADLQALGLVVEAVPTPGNFGRSCDPAVETQVPDAGETLERGMHVLLAVNLDLDYSSTPAAADCRAWDAVDLGQFDELTASVLAQLDRA